MKNTTD